MTPEEAVLLLSALRESLLNLEGAIEMAEIKVANNPNFTTVIQDRFNSYKEIIAKQNLLADELEYSIGDGSAIDTNSVTRTVNLTNALSQMIKDDAADLVMELAYNNKIDKDSLN